MTKVQSGFFAASLAATLATGCNSLFGIDEGKLRPMCVDPQGLLIDDMEDDEASICQLNGRNGGWYAVGDDTGADLTPGTDFKPTLIPGGRGSSQYAARFTGSCFTDWGALMGFSLKVENLATNVYDVSAGTAGIKFWMKNDVPISVGLAVPDTVPSDQPFGTCNDGGVFRNCYNDFVFEARPSGNERVEYTVPFAAFEQRAFLHDDGTNLVAGSAQWDPTHLLGIEFSAHYSAFDVWVDDLRFYSCQADDCVPTCSVEEPVACPASGGLPAGCWPEGTDCSKPRERIRNTAVWGSGPDDVWVVGYSRTTLQGSLRHWKGSGWVPTAGVTAPPVWGVWGSSADNVWAVADHGTVLFWNGSDWSSAAGAATTSTLNGVGVAAPATSGPSRRQAGCCTGSTLTGFPPPPAPPIGSSVFGQRPQRRVVRRRPRDHPSLERLRLDGHDQRRRSPCGRVGQQPRRRLGRRGSRHDCSPDRLRLVRGAEHHRSVSAGRVGQRPNDVWAVGEVGTIVHWDGSKWSAVPSGTTRRLLSVWGSGPDDVWAVGLEIILRWNGQTWSVQP